MKLPHKATLTINYQDGTKGYQFAWNGWQWFNVSWPIKGWTVITPTSSAN